MKRRTRIALVLAVATITLEVGLRVTIRDDTFLDQPLPPFGAITHPRQRAWLEAKQSGALGVTRFDAELGWTARAGFQDPGGAETINSIGARGAREYADDPPSGILRLTTFGDSFTYGAHVAGDETWQAALEARHERVEVLNFGVGGYGTDQALLRARRQRSRLAGTFAVLGLMLENVGRNVNRYRPLWYPKAGGAVAKPRFRLAEGDLTLVPSPARSQDDLLASVRDGTILERLAPHEHWLDRPDLGLLRHVALGRIAGALWAHRERDVARLWCDPGGEPRAVTLAIVRTFAREVLEAGALGALIVVFPREDDLRSLRDGDAYWADAVAELRQDGLDVLDVAPALAARWDALGGASGLYRHGHLTAAANAVVAEAIARHLRATELGAAAFAR